MFWTIIIIAILLIFYKFFRDTNQTNSELVRVGGLITKYGLLIDKLKSFSSKMQTKINEPNLVVIGFSFEDGGYKKFRFQVVSKILHIDFETKDNVYGVRKLSWKFDENLNQDKMFNSIKSDVLHRASLDLNS